MVETTHRKYGTIAQIVNTTDFKVIDKNLLNNKQKTEICQSVMDQRPKNDVEHAREIAFILCK